MLAVVSEQSSSLDLLIFGLNQLLVSYIFNLWFRILTFWGCISYMGHCSLPSSVRQRLDPWCVERNNSDTVCIHMVFLIGAMKKNALTHQLVYAYKINKSSRHDKTYFTCFWTYLYLSWDSTKNHAKTTTTGNYLQKTRNMSNKWRKINWLVLLSSGQSQLQPTSLSCMEQCMYEIQTS